MTLLLKHVFLSCNVYPQLHSRHVQNMIFGWHLTCHHLQDFPSSSAIEVVQSNPLPFLSLPVWHSPRTLGRTYSGVHHD